MATQLAGGTRAQWLASSLILADRQPGICRNPDGTLEVRVGDGVHTFFQLPAADSVAALKSGTLATLTTTAKGSLVAAVNELVTSIAGRVAKNTLVWNLRDQAGVVGNGTADDTAAINTAAAAAAAAGVRLFATGTFKITGTVTLTGDCDLAGATFNYAGASSGTALVVGSSSVTFRRRFHLPAVVNVNKTTTGWAQSGVTGTTGIKLLNLNACWVRTPRVKGFAVGLLVRGEGQGNSYNRIEAGHLEDNQVQHDISADATGWSNENQYQISRFSFASGEGASVSGTRDIRVQTAASIPNNNVWIGGSVEGDTPEYHVECAGGENRWLNVRWENGSTGCRVWWRTGAFRNTIDRGYASHQITETYEGTTSGQDVLTGQGWKLRESASTKGLLQLENSSSSSNPAITIMAAGAANAGSDAATVYAGKWGPNELLLRRSTESFDRIKLDAQNSRIYMGTGGAAPTMYLSAVSTSGFAMNAGHLYSGTDNTYDIGLITSLRFRYIRAATALVTGSGATGSRPAAATAGIGAMFYDTTLGKPIWCTGSGWVDATGTTV